jgi:hypothetical protein
MNAGNLCILLIDKFFKFTISPALVGLHDVSSGIWSDLDISSMLFMYSVSVCKISTTRSMSIVLVLFLQLSTSKSKLSLTTSNDNSTSSAASFYASHCNPIMRFSGDSSPVMSPHSSSSERIWPIPSLPAGFSLGVARMDLGVPVLARARRVSAVFSEYMVFYCSEGPPSASCCNACTAHMETGLCGLKVVCALDCGGWAQPPD